MKQRKDVTDNDLLDQNNASEDENKTKREIRIEKHAKLRTYLEEKRLREELDSIDGW